MAKAIQNQVVTNIEGRPMQVPELDEDGRPVMERDQHKLKPAKAADLLRVLVFSIPRVIQTPADPHRASQLFHTLDGDKPTIELSPKVYDWLHRLLNRPLPKERDALEALTYAQTLWGINAYAIVQQLKDASDKDAEEEAE